MQGLSEQQFHALKFGVGLRYHASSQSGNEQQEECRTSNDPSVLFNTDHSKDGQNDPKETCGSSRMFAIGSEAFDVSAGRWFGV